ncbi:MAG: DVUA0089 family protein, partial [Pleurocapsa sp. MO_226.B13]|nr:DVUA0089 family protein [Pleurocapsa sp. MO_226.B13]
DAELIGSSLDPILTVFDSAGTLVAQNDDDDSSLDSLIDFTAGVGNTYYVGVSSYANFDYDPLIEDSGTGDSSGFYDLYFSIDGPVVPNAEPNDTIAEATDTGLFGEGTYNISTEIGNNPNLVAPENDVDLFELYLDAGDRLVADIDAELIGSSLDPILTVFDSAGTLVAQNDDDDSSLDSLIDFTAGVGDTYYVGVSSYANFDYDPLIEDSGSGYSSGFYDLYLSIDVV